MTSDSGLVDLPSSDLLKCRARATPGALDAARASATEARTALVYALALACARHGHGAKILRFYAPRPGDRPIGLSVYTRSREEGLVVCLHAEVPPDLAA